MKYFLFTKRANVVVNSMVQAVSDHLNLLCKSHLVTMKLFTFQGGAQISDSDIPCSFGFHAEEGHPLSLSYSKKESGSNDILYIL